MGHCASMTDAVSGVGCVEHAHGNLNTGVLLHRGQSLVFHNVDGCHCMAPHMHTAQCWQALTGIVSMLHSQAEGVCKHVCVRVIHAPRQPN